MKITSTAGTAAPLSVAAPGTAAAAPNAAASPDTELQSAALLKAQAALKELPEIDQARVAELREALAQGRLPFDAGKLAGLIDRYHGGRS